MEEILKTVLTYRIVNEVIEEWERGEVYTVDIRRKCEKRIAAALERLDLTWKIEEIPHEHLGI